LQRRQGEPERRRRREAARKPLNSLLQNQKLRLRALSSKPASLLGKFPDDEVVRDCGRNNKNGPLLHVDPYSSHPEEETAQHRFWSQTWPPCTSRRRTRSPVI